MKSESLLLAEKLRKASAGIFTNKKLLIQAADLLEQLQDECNSVWDMLDEFKKSDIKNFDNIFKAVRLERSTKKNLQDYKRKKKDNGTTD